MIIVKFLKHYTCYFKGDTANFEDRTADFLISQRIAEVLPQPKANIPENTEDTDSTEPIKKKK